MSKLVCIMTSKLNGPSRSMPPEVSGTNLRVKQNESRPNKWITPLLYYNKHSNATRANLLQARNSLTRPHKNWQQDIAFTCKQFQSNSGNICTQWEHYHQIVTWNYSALLWSTSLLTAHANGWCLCCIAGMIAYGKLDMRDLVRWKLCHYLYSQKL